MTCVACKNEREREIYRNDPAKAAERTRAWQASNRDRHNKRAVAYMTNRRKTDEFFRFKQDVSLLICNSLRRKGYPKEGRAAAILGCDYEFFLAHLERQFLPGMGWQNRSEWQIDHITPMASASSREEALALNHFTNLRPIWAADNLEKRDKILFLI